MVANPLVKLAKEAVESYIRNNKIIGPDSTLPGKYLKEKAGVFVSIHRNGKLRGCIGTYAPTKENIAREIIANAIEAATGDPRFDTVKKSDLPLLAYEVYILEKPELIDSASKLDPKVFGVIVTGNESKRTGLLLPGLEGIDTVEQQLACVCQKAGIDPNEEKTMLYRFRAEKF